MTGQVDHLTLQSRVNMKIDTSKRNLSVLKTKFRKYHSKHGNQNKPDSQDQDSIWIVNETIGEVVSGQEAPIQKYKWSESKTSNFLTKSEWPRKSKISKRRSTSTSKKIAIFMTYFIIQSSIFMFFTSIEKQCTYDCRNVGLTIVLMLMIFVLSTLLLIVSLLLNLFDSYENWMDFATPFIFLTIFPSLITMTHFL